MHPDQEGSRRSHLEVKHFMSCQAREALLVCYLHCIQIGPQGERMDGSFGFLDASYNVKILFGLYCSLDGTNNFD